MIFTVEEENMLCAFNTSSRAALISEIRNALLDFDEPEMRELAENVLVKLDAVIDAEFSALTFSPTYYNENDESEV